MRVIAPLLLDAPDPEARPVVDCDFAAVVVVVVVRGGENFGDEIRLSGVVVSLGEVPPGHGDVVLDGAVAVQVVEVQTGNAEGVDLSLCADAEGPEDGGERVAEEGPEAAGGRVGWRVLVLEVGDGGEELAEGDADAEDGHGGSQLRGLDVAAGAGDVAVVGEGVDDGAGTAEVGGGGGAIFAFWEGEEGGGFVGFGGGGIIHVGVVFVVSGADGWN